MKIFVLGSNGMLGQYLHRYFKGSMGVTRDMLNALLIRDDLFKHQLDLLRINKGDVVINAIGITNKQKKDNWEYIVVNSLFPRLLADYCEDIGANMIHISTDCVYDGKCGYYSESYKHNDENIYGLSKSAGEPNNCTVIRTSIIGENRNSNLDLLEWVRSHENTTINGWTNHYWNGITCLQFAKVCETIIKNNSFWKGVRHIHSPKAVTKAHLITMIDTIYCLWNEVVNKDADIACNRILISEYDLTEYNIPDIYDQIVEQKGWIYSFL